ncbi:protein ovarian tumor locus isoform X2 [Episyrphus balteatus]|uniref:protein ovarian tumor locus isoform X2 n=1 Tax=Episyrphus balteatus TaxID=286459 RepID=UPI002485A0B9|nr:protein ovarian tumor locus isoform X2 [Episyrphus balteatus]
MQRPFTSGSRQAPDPFDQYLEENNFYRKHTARDASCLFRTISEQVYDTQQYHLTIRKKCVSYMRKHRSYFESQVDKDLDEYLDDMSKPKSYGTLIELQAVSFVFKRNVLLFEPYTLGSNFSYRPDFSDVFRVFYTPERHFDSVFTSDYIKDVAICQSICYEILYKDLFKLPDVTFAVEQMLHSSSLETSSYTTECNEDGYCTKIIIEDGRSFEFDLPENTLCILENHRLCHFHNPNFPRFSEDLQRELKETKKEDNEHKFLSKTVDSLLTDKYISCVRQLLLEGITPFPYKVAKALDPNMYRNIEFDSWNEARKELKLQNWYNGDSNFKVGAKCHVKLQKSESDLYTCHIQEIAMEKGYCVVFIEQLGEKRLVPYDSLKPLPADQFKPWSLPYHLQRHIQKCNTYRYSRQFNYRFKVDQQFTSQYCLSNLKSSDDFYDNPKHKSDCIYKLNQFTHLENFQTQTMEYCTMPLTVEHSRDMTDSKLSHRNDSSRAQSRCSDIPKTDCAGENCGGGVVYENNPEQQEASPDGPQVYTTAAYTDEYLSYGFDPSIIQTGPQALIPNGGGPMYYMYNAGYPPAGGMYMPAPPPPQMIATTQNHVGFCPQYYQVPQPSSGSGGYNGTPSIHRRQSNTTPLTGRINFDVKKSVKANGSDLPVDVATLRYFFNLGLEYHQKLYKNIDLSIDSKEGISKVSPDMQLAKLDENGNDIGVKPDPNNNINPSKNNNNNNYSGQNKQNNGQRRFPSRYFNNKERHNNYRSAPPNNRYHQNDYNNSGGGGSGGANKGHKSNPNHQSAANNNSTPNSRNGSSSNNIPRPGSAGNSLSAPEFVSQGSPMVTFGTVENCDLMQTPTTYNANGQIVTSYVGPYMQEFDQQQHPQAVQQSSSGLYMPMPVGASPYGIYAAGPSGPPVAMHSTGGYPYLSGPPPAGVPMHSPSHTGMPGQNPMAPTYYATPGAESGGPTLVDASVDPNHYPCVGYPPPVQFYYSPTNGVPSSNNQPVGSPGLGPQGYWCIPPPIQTQPSPQPVTMLASCNQPQPSGNRRDIPPKQQTQHPSGEQ